MVSSDWEEAQGQITGAGNILLFGLGVSHQMCSICEKSLSNALWLCPC